MGFPVGIVPFGDSKMEKKNLGDGDGGESPPERGVGMRMIFYPRPAETPFPITLLN
jgi:hypothetical protein